MTDYIVVLTNVKSRDELTVEPSDVDTEYERDRVRLAFQMTMANAVYNYSIQLAGGDNITETITISEGNTLCTFHFPIEGLVLLSHLAMLNDHCVIPLTKTHSFHDYKIVMIVPFGRT